jgi:hypothetical protein
MAKAKKLDYASLYNLRKDGRYCARDSTGRMYYDRDPEKLWHKLNDPKEPEVVTFRQIAEAWEKEHWERIGYKTQEAYTAPVRRLNDKFGDMEAGAVTAQMIYAYLVALGGQGYSRRSVQMHRDILNMIFNHAIVSGVLTVNPCAAVSLPKGLQTTTRRFGSPLRPVRYGLPLFRPPAW